MKAAGTKRVTGERVMTRSGGFNPTWQRHAAAYRAAAAQLAGGLVLDLGCGVGHSAARLSSSVGVDLDPDALRGQGRPVVCADMRRLPLQAQAFAGVVSVQSIEHVPDPGVVVAEVARVLDVAGVAVFVTPNRLTFGRPEEIIDPWHYIEFDPEQFGDLCRQDFADVTVLGLFGSASYLEFNAHEHRTLDRMLRLDPLRLRRLVSRGVRQRAYDTALNRYRGRVEHPVAAGITIEDFFVADHDLAECLDVIAVCRSPRSAHR